MQSLLEKEIQLLNGIDRRRNEIQSEIQEQKQNRILKLCGEPVKWVGYNSKAEYQYILKIDSLHRNIFLRCNN